MKSLIAILIMINLVEVRADGRALLGALNSPIKATEVAPTGFGSCSTVNSLGALNAQFQSRNETFKILKLKPLSSQEVTLSSLQNLKDAFMQATSVFKNNFDLELDSPASLIQTRSRLLANLGYNEKTLEQTAPKTLLQKFANDDLRWKAALQKVSCSIQNCKVGTELAIAFDAILASKSFRKDIESALLEQASESLSVDEMLGGRIIPNERARLRLFSALLNQIGIQNETRWNCNKTSGSLHFSSRLEVAIGKDIWASDTALSSDYTQKSSQICFSSLAKLNEICSAKKGASL